MAVQLGFDLPSVTALGRADFLVAPSNAFAVMLIEDWHNWSPRKLIICGPEGAGKTHLSHVWSGMSNAEIIEASHLREPDIPELARGSVVIENVPDIAGNAAAETLLFHLHNLVLAEGHALLITGKDAPRRWSLELPDLRSRIIGTQTAMLEPPDDALLAAVLAKLMADRQIYPKPNVIPYLMSRIDRSFSAAREIVARLDAASLALQRPVTRNLARAVLDNTAQIER